MTICMGFSMFFNMVFRIPILPPRIVLKKKHFMNLIDRCTLVADNYHIMDMMGLVGPLKTHP